MSLLIRRATNADLDTLTDIVFRSKQSNGYDDAFMEACRDELRITRDSLRKRSYWVAEDGKLVGCAALAPACCANTGEVHAFFIDPHAQGRGIGRLLWAALAEHAKYLAFQYLTLDADPEAVPFYRRLGFEIAGESPSGSIPGRMLPRMKIDLLAQSPAEPPA